MLRLKATPKATPKVCHQCHRIVEGLWLIEEFSGKYALWEKCLVLLDGIK